MACNSASSRRDHRPFRANGCSSISETHRSDGWAGAPRGPTPPAPPARRAQHCGGATASRRGRSSDHRMRRQAGPSWPRERTPATLTSSPAFSRAGTRTVRASWRLRSGRPECAPTRAAYLPVTSRTTARRWGMPVPDGSSPPAGRPGKLRQPWAAQARRPAPGRFVRARAESGRASALTSRASRTASTTGRTPPPDRRGTQVEVRAGATPRPPQDPGTSPSRGNGLPGVPSAAFSPPRLRLRPSVARPRPRTAPLASAADGQGRVLPCRRRRGPYRLAAVRAAPTRSCQETT